MYVDCGGIGRRVHSSLDSRTGKKGCRLRSRRKWLLAASRHGIYRPERLRYKTNQLFGIWTGKEAPGLVVAVGSPTLNI